MNSPTIDTLRKHFDKPLIEAAYKLNLCPTSLKRKCRKLGITRWPYRRVNIIFDHTSFIYFFLILLLL